MGIIDNREPKLSCKERLKIRRQTPNREIPAFEAVAKTVTSKPAPADSAPPSSDTGYTDYQTSPQPPSMDAALIVSIFSM